jgi:hypothetical protein
VAAVPRVLVLAGDAIEAAACELALETGLPGYPEAVDSVPGLLEAAEQALLVGPRSGDAVVAARARHNDEPPAGRW